MDLQKQFNAADEKTDMKALCQQAISLLSESETDNAALKSALDDAEIVVGQLGAKLDLQEKTKDLPGIAVNVGDDQKLLVGKKFKIKGTVYTAEQVAADPELLSFLAGIKSGSLVELPAEITNGSTANASA